MEKPDIPDAEVQSFAFCVGKTIQNFGTIEYLVNELIAILTADSVIASHLVKQIISKRLDVLEPLANRRRAELDKNGFRLNGLFSSARTAFRDRNKIAHNPFVIRLAHTKDGAKQTAGIHVIRYHEEGHNEEWIEKAQLEAITATSRDLVERFNTLLGLCKAS